MGDVEISPTMQELRDELDARGIVWIDASDEVRCDGYRFHMERTKVLREGREIASCIWGFSGPYGYETGSSYGWPWSIECMSDLLPCGDPVPMEASEIVRLVDPRPLARLARRVRNLVFKVCQNRARR